MHVAARTSSSSSSASSSSASSSSRFIPSPFARPVSPDAKFEREPSDMAKELLHRVLGGLGRSMSLSVRDQQVLFHFLYGRSPALVGKQLDIRETTVHKHLHRIYARTGTESRRELLHLGRRLADQHGLRAVA